MIYNDGTYEENGEVWFVGYEDNILYHMNINHEISIVAKIPTKSEDTYRMNPNCIKNGNEIICLPTQSHSIYIYNIGLDEFREIPIELDVMRYSIDNAWVDGDILWCICYRSGQLIKCNLISGTTKTYDVCDKRLEYVSGEGIKIDNYIYILHKNKCMITKFDIITEQVYNFNLPCDDRGFGTISYDGKKIYLTGFKKRIYIWNEIENTIETVSIDKMIFLKENESESKTPRFLKSKLVNEYLVILPFNNEFYVSDEVVVYNCISNEIKVYSLSDSIKERQSGEYLMYNYSIKNKIFIQDYSIKKFWSINLSTQEISKEGLVKDRDNCVNYWKKCGIDGVHTENDILDLNVFLNCI